MQSCGNAAPAGQAPHAGAVQVLRCAEAEVGTALRWSLAAGMDIVCPASHVPSQEGCTDAGDWRYGGGDSTPCGGGSRGSGDSSGLPDTPPHGSGDAEAWHDCRSSRGSSASSGGGGDAW